MGKYTVAVFDDPDSDATAIVVLDGNMQVKSYETARGEAQVERMTTMALRRCNMANTMVQPPEL